ncbi:claudin-10 [Melanotaenia boesemani]|uniref:claudin-10 n=1 Tax=Melanotaenia boesemani TaxID=1250792 RepID=UPI001C046CB2|nr:claudin-10 [Melanotaenia boesemani]
MKIRVVQIWGFLMTVLGWIFVACTMAMERWKISAVSGQGGRSVMTVAWYWSSLWKSCFTDSTAVTNCYDFPMLWSVEGHIQIVRGLLMAALSLGMLGFILSLLGMECTYIGGKDRSKHKKIYSGGLCHIISGVLSSCGYAVYAQYVSIEFFTPDFTGLRFNLGTPVFLGWVGSVFHVAGGFFHLWSVCKPLCGEEATVITMEAQPDPEQNKSTMALSTVLGVTSKTKLSSSTERSFRSGSSDVSSISTKSESTSSSGRSSSTGRTVQSIGSAGSSRSSRSSRSGTGSELQFSISSKTSQSVLSESSRSQTVSLMSQRLRNKTQSFSKNSYI